jgi:chromosome segregation ATPase
MKWFGKSAQQERIDGLAFENAELVREVRELRTEVANTGILLTSARDSRDIALRRNSHLEAEVEKLAADVAGLLPDAEKYRAQRAKAKLNLRQFQAAVAEASVAASSGAVV